MKDGKYGNDVYGNGTWDGMIGEILRGVSFEDFLKSDFRFLIRTYGIPFILYSYPRIYMKSHFQETEMAVAPLTVNFRRSEVVDFTKPFLSLGISILYKVFVIYLNHQFFKLLIF